ncbi:MAG: pyruvate oxidase [Syntrophobacteraceae bacterium]
MTTLGKGKTGLGPGGLVADYVLNRLKEWGVHRIYGYPGDGINGFLGALDRAKGNPEIMQVRHEEMAAFMASAHAKFTGDLGVCMATSGPGAIHLLNGLYDAKLDHQPVLAIVGQQKQLSVEAPPRMHGSVFSSLGYVKPVIVPPAEQLDRAAKVLNAGKKVAILVGQGAAKAEDLVIETAEILGGGIAKALLGRTHPPDDLDFVTGSIGLLGTKPSWDMMTGCDVLFMIGTSFPYGEWLPEESSCKCVEIDIDARYLGHRFPADVPLVGDSRDTLQALLPRLEYKKDRSWREKIEKEVRQWWSLMEDRAMQSGTPINPQRVMHELSRRLPDHCILTADSGSSTNWWARQLKMRKGMDATLSGTLASMGPATPYAIAARFAFPDRPIIATIGDGAFQMNGMNEMITIKRYEKRLMEKRKPFIFCIFNNQDLNQVTWEQRVLAGDPKFMGTQCIPDFPYARYAELLGFKGIYCDNPEVVGRAWEEALSTTDRPVILEFKTDPEIPPLPPHIKFDQARKLMSALMGDEPERWGIVKKAIKGKAAEFKEKITGEDKEP